MTHKKEKPKDSETNLPCACGACIVDCYLQKEIERLKSEKAELQVRVRRWKRQYEKLKKEERS